MPDGFNWRARANLGLSVILAKGLHRGAAGPIIGKQAKDDCLLFGAITHKPLALVLAVFNQVIGGVGQHFASMMVSLPHIGFFGCHGYSLC